MLLSPKHRLTILPIVINLILRLYFNGEWSSANQSGRTNLANKGEEMKITGIRNSRNGGLGHFKKDHKVRSVEALGC